MLKRGKKKDEEEYASDGDAPPKKISKKDSADDDSDDGDDVVVCEISKNRRVSVRNWQGKIVVDIREFYVKDGKQMPGKKEVFHYPWISGMYFETMLMKLTRQLLRMVRKLEDMSICLMSLKEALSMELKLLYFVYLLGN
ncbi:unnamed protein product [Camellia sinensis]